MRHIVHHQGAKHRLTGRVVRFPPASVAVLSFSIDGAATHSIHHAVPVYKYGPHHPPLSILARPSTLECKEPLEATVSYWRTRAASEKISCPKDQRHRQQPEHQEGWLATAPASTPQHYSSARLERMWTETSATSECVCFSTLCKFSLHSEWAGREKIYQGSGSNSAHMESEY